MNIFIFGIEKSCNIQQLMVLKDISPVRKDEIYLVLVELDRLFGHTFDEAPDVIFPVGSFDDN